MNELDSDLLQSIAAACPGFQARATARAITRYYNAHFKPLDMTAEQFSLLVGIGKAGKTTVVDLAASSGVEATTLSRSVQKLESKGWVCTEGGRGRAGKQIRLSKSGESVLESALPLWKAAHTELSEKIGQAQLESTTQAMLVLAKASTLT